MQDADLLVLEFTINEPPYGFVQDVPMAGAARRAFEQLVRRVLRMPRAPAVIMLHHYAWWHAAADGADGGIFYAPAEAQLGTMAQYYGARWGWPYGAGWVALVWACRACGHARALAWWKRVQ